MGGGGYFRSGAAEGGNFPIFHHFSLVLFSIISASPAPTAVEIIKLADLISLLRGEYPLRFTAIECFRKCDFLQ